MECGDWIGMGPTTSWVWMLDYGSDTTRRCGLGKVNYGLGGGVPLGVDLEASNPQESFSIFPLPED